MGSPPTSGPGGGHAHQSAGPAVMLLSAQLQGGEGIRLHPYLACQASVEWQPVCSKGRSPWSQRAPTLQWPCPSKVAFSTVPVRPCKLLR